MPPKEIAVRILILFGVIASGLFIVHGAFLVKNDLENRQTPAVAPSGEPASLPASPSPRVTSRPTPAAPVRPLPAASTEEASTGTQIPPKPETRQAAFAVLPGKAFNLPNRHFRKVIVRADYPIRVYSGNCHNDYTVQWMCEGEPADIFITDTRAYPVFTAPRANNVTITLIEF
jgi:hypothetical protein